MRNPLCDSNLTGGGGAKTLLAALFAGCLVLSSASAAYSADGNPSPILDKLNTAGTLVPDSNSVYPPSEYTLTQVVPVDIHNLEPNVIKIYDPNNFGEEVRYFEIGFKNPVYGEGSAVKYYVWDKDDNGVKLIKTDNPDEAVLTLKFDPENPVLPFKNISGNTVESLNEIFIEQDIKNIISVGGIVNNLSSVFKGNNLVVTNEDEYNYSAIIAEYNGDIKNINSSFIGNSVDVVTDNKVVYGPFIKDLSNVNNIYSEFIANTVKANSATVNGGMIEVSDAGVLGKLSSDFLLNSVISQTGDIEGVIFANDGKVSAIDGAMFLGNYGVSQAGDVSGGVIYNNRGVIDKVTGSLFEGNYVSSGSGEAAGGAIYNVNRIDSIENSIFTDNFASSASGEAVGGAIYTDSNLKIAANDGKVTEFTGNYVLNNGVREDQAIYVDGAVLTLEATDGGRILLNDIINGTQGYDVLLTGDGSGKISIYNQILNADIEARAGAVVDFADGKNFDYDIRSLKADNGAVFSIDANFADGTSDTLTIGSGSGVIYIDDINLSGDLAAEGIVQVLTSPDTISIGLTDKLIAQFNKRVEDGEAYEVIDEVKAASGWGDEYEAHTYQDYIEEGIRTAITDESRGTADSIEYYIEEQTDEVLTETLGDTLKLLAEDSRATRSFTAASADDVYTLSDDGGVMASGSYTISGVRNSQTGKLSTIDADGHSLVEVQAGTLTYKDVNITNTALDAGAVMNISGSDAVGRFSGNVVIDTIDGTNGIVNNGTLTIMAGADVTSDTSIIGTGSLTTEANSVFNLINGASIDVGSVNIAGGTVMLGADSTLEADSIEVKQGTLDIAAADNLLSDVTITNSVGKVYLGSGTLGSAISGGRGDLYIKGNVINEALLEVSRINLNEAGVSLTTNADNLKSVVNMTAAASSGGSFVDLTGGTVTKNINAKTNVTGDVTLNANASGAWSVAEGASLTTDAGYINWDINMANSGTVNLTGGSLAVSHDISGGTINILGDVTTNSVLKGEIINVTQGAKLTTTGGQLASETIRNDGILSFTGGTLNESYIKNPIEGAGTVEFKSNTTALSDVTINQAMHVLAGATLTTNSAENLGADVTVDGTIIFTGENSNLNHNITGSGQAQIQGTVTNNAEINLDNSIYITSGTLYTNASDISASIIEGYGDIYLSGGTLNTDIKIQEGSLNTHIQENADVISNAIIGGGGIVLQAGSSLTIDADNIGENNAVTLREASNLILGDGIIDFQILGQANDRTVTIAGDVGTDKFIIYPSVYIKDGGSLTTDIALINQQITNDGSLYLTGNLQKKIAGSGTTYIDKEIQIGSASNVSIDGTLNLNDGVLRNYYYLGKPDETLKTININKATGEGDLKLNINFGSLKADKINLTDVLSDAIFRISADDINFMGVNSRTPDTDPIQILDGGTGAQLQIIGDGSFSEHVYKDYYDPIRADVYFDDQYNRYYTNGTVSGKIELAQTDSVNDSLKFTGVITEWDEEQTERAHLLRDLNLYKTDEEQRYFRFRTADDEYVSPITVNNAGTVTSNLGVTVAGVLNIVGVSETLADGTVKRSTIDMNRGYGFEVKNTGTTLNLSDVQFKNGRYFVVNMSNHNSIGTIDEEGHVSGGIINTSFINTNSGGTYADSSSQTYSAVRVADSIISQIIDSEFKDNTSTLTNTGSTVPYKTGSALSISNTQVGSSITGEGGIINTVFENNSAALYGSGKNQYVYGAAIYMAYSDITTIKDSVFKNNTITSDISSAQGGAIWMHGSSTIGSIENTQFINNHAVTGASNNNGGAIYTQGTIGTIKDSLFEGNTVDNYAGGAIYQAGDIGEIINTEFKNNSATYGGAIFVINKNLNITDSLFSGNTTTQSGGAISAYDAEIGTITGTDFIGNSSVNSGGGAYIYANSTLDTISDSNFENNSLINNNSGSTSNGAGLYIGDVTFNNLTDTTFLNNHIEANTSGYGGGLRFYNVTANTGEISGLTFDRNSIKATTASGGGANISNSTISTLKDSVFKNNIVEGTGSASGGGMILSSTNIINIENLTFENNGALGRNGASGGALYLSTARLTNGIVNSTFRNNYVINTNDQIANTYGGAIYTIDSLKIVANNDGVTEFTGNYRMVEGDESSKIYEAIYLSGNNKVLTLNAITGGTIIMNDSIRGSSNTSTVALTGDNSGTIQLYNNINNLRVSADSVNIKTANNQIFDYNFSRLTAYNSAKFNIDLDALSASADNFTVGANSLGTLYLDNINLINSADENKIIQIIHAKDDSIQLAINSQNINLSDDLVQNLSDTVYNNVIYHQEEGFKLATTDTKNDSLMYFADITFDGLDLISASTLNEVRNFVFDDNSTYLATVDISDVAAGTLNILGLKDDENLSTIDFDSHKAFNLVNDSILNVNDTKLTNANGDVIYISHDNAEVNLNNAVIDGSVTASASQNINILGNAEFKGAINGAIVNLTAGTLSMAQNTFQNAGLLNATAGRVSLANSITGENYIFSNLNSGEDTRYVLDLDLANAASDTITVQNGSGVITIGEVNFFNEVGDKDDFTLQILNAQDDSIQLALADDLENFTFKELSRIESDEIKNETSFSDIYYDRERLGKVQSQLTLETTSTTNDSLHFSIEEVWDDFTTQLDPTGDTLKLVAQAENLDNKTFSSSDASEIYQVSDDIGKIASGSFTISGTSNDGNMSTINFNEFNAFEVGENSGLTISDTRLTGAEDIIHVTDSTGTVKLDGAVIDGNITGDEKFNLAIDSTKETTLNGTVHNANTTFSKGSLIFAENTFADADTSLNVTGGQVALDNGKLDNFVINDLQSSLNAVYSLDVDLSQGKADTITVGENSTGPIVLSEFNMTGVLDGIKPEDTYTIKILDAQNNNTYLDLSESIKSQLATSDIHLGYERVLDSTDPINAHSSWDNVYNINYRDNEIRGRLDLYTQNTTNDSLYLYDITIHIGDIAESQGDTLMLVNQLDDADRSFTTNDPNKIYNLSDDIGSTASGTFTVAGAADGAGNISTIDMNRYTGFVLDNEGTTLNISNIKFQNLNFADGSLINITEKGGIANLNNVIIEVSNSLNAITNAGSLNMTGGKVILNSGIAGEGTTSVTGGADVLLSNGAHIEQSNIFVTDGSLTVDDRSVLESILAIGEKGSVTTAVDGITSDVDNDGNITFTEGDLEYNISGEGTTNIAGEVINSALIDNDVNVKSGKLTSSAEAITGAINNEAELLLSGTLGKGITGSGTTIADESLNLAKGAAIEGVLDLNNAVISTADNETNDYEIGAMVNDGDFSINVDLTNRAADKFIVGEDSQGTLTLTDLNILGDINIEDIPENPEDYKIQILQTPTDAIQLALSTQLEQDLNNDEFFIKEEHVLANTDIQAKNKWTDTYSANDFIRKYYGKLGLTTTDTKNDSIGITGIRWEDSEDVVSLGDTLALVNKLETEEDRTFEANYASEEYTVKENLGKTAQGSISVIGIQSEDGNRKSTIDFNTHSGFETGDGVELNISNTEIKNAAAAQGSVINSTEKGAQITLTNTNLTDNIATGEHGGAIYSASDITIAADGGNSVIEGNKTANDDEAIYLTGAKLTLNTVNNGNAYIHDKINGDNGYLVAFSGDKSGNVYLNNEVKNAKASLDNVTLNLSGNNHFETTDFTINSGTLNLVNDKTQEQIAKSLTINGSFNLNADVDLENAVMDRLPENTVIANADAFINVDKLNLISDTKAQTVEIPFAYAGFKDNVQYTGPAELSRDTQVTTLFAPIYKYSLEYENRDDLGYFVFTRGAGYSPSSPEAFNPSVLTSPVAAQAGAFAAMNETFNYAFRHSDAFSMLPASERLAVHLADRYAINDSDAVLKRSLMKDNGFWVQPYANFESIGLKNGPSVDVISYGTLIGGDSEYITLDNGWGTVTTAYVGYNGSTQDFSGVSTTQNGGLLGATQTFYKDNFFTALTASAGASVGDSSTMYGSETFAMLLSGIASKSGFNFEFKDGKYIIQPSMLLSYTFVNTFDYTNAAGVKISSDPLHTIQLHPSVKFAANLNNGWQPYAFAGMVWNILNDTKFTANNIVLPDMSIKPYVEYGLGIQKSWNDSLSGFFQTMIRNGGRNGVALSFGFKWILGKDNKPEQILFDNNGNKIVNSTKQRKVIKQLNPQQKTAFGNH